MEQFDIAKQTELLQKTTIKSIKGLFPIAGQNRTLHLTDVWADDRLDPGDFQSQFKAKVGERTWGVPIYGSFAILDKGGKVLKKKEKVRLVTLPKLTPRFSYIVKGTEHQIANQLRLRPAGYTVRTGPGGIKGQINLAKGYSGQIEMHAKPETGVFRLKVGQAYQRLYPILNALGVSDAEMAKRWGDEVLQANKDMKPAEYDNSIKSFAKSVLRRNYTNTESAAEALRDFVKDTAMDGDINKRTLGASHKNMSGLFLADMSKSILSVLKGEKDPHDRNALEFKEYRQLADLIEERLSMNEYKNKVTRTIRNNLNSPARAKVEDIVGSSVINHHIEAVFNLPELHQLPKQLNPVDMFNTASMVTVMGPGGIREKHQITDDMRNVHPSHLGFLDPVHTPESASVGVVYHLPAGVSSKEKTLLTRAINLKTGKLERIDPAKFADSVIAFPGQRDAKGKWRNPKEVVVLGKGNETKTVSSKEVDYILQSPKQVFSVASNLVPFLPTNSGGRTLLAAKLAEQAVPLQHREIPLVQTKLGGKTTFEKLMGDAFSITSDVDGTVSKVKDDRVTVKDSEGKTQTYQVYKNFPLNFKSFVDSEVRVKAGDKVKKDQVLADTNFTKDGILALGKNLKTAYVPYKGYNFEDGIVITDEAAKKLTSEHLYSESAQASDRFMIDKRRFVAHYPAVYTKSQIDKLDDGGVIKKGTVLQPGDPVIARLRKDEIDPENLQLAKLSRTLVRPWKNDSISWHGDVPGEVVDVQRHGNRVKVYIKTREPAQIGDKLVGRFGNKGIVTRVIPEAQAPHDGDGNPVDIMLNPHGVITRINIGQILENAITKKAIKDGKPYVVDNFSGENYTKAIQTEMDKAGLSDTEELFDPETGKSIGKVNVGNTYILKLEKQARSQFSARGAGPGWRYSQHTQEAVKGGEEGSKALDLLTFYSMLAHGSRSNLREMATYKATRNDDFWSALKTGSLLPAPKPTFAYNKFISYLKGAGVNVKQEGSSLTLSPMTDKEVDKISNGPIKDFQFVRAKDLAELKGGLMDRQITGGLRGTHWSHIDLSEPIVNPIFEQPVKSLLKLKNREFKGLLEGRMYVNKEGAINEEGDGVTAGTAFKQMLKKVDIKALMDDFVEQAKKAKNPDQLNRANRGIRYIEALNRFGLKPTDAYMLNKIPVLPPVFRPIYALPDGNLHTSPVNFLYRDLGLVNEKLKFFNSLEYMPEDAKQAIRKDLYNGAAAVAGLGNPITFYPPSRPVKGIIKEISGVGGEGSKSGFFQKHVIRREQDLVGRGTIIPEPKLGVDEVGLPEEMSWTIFQPFVMREMINQGYRPADADKEIANRSFIARNALDTVMNERPVLLNRAPSLHKFSIMAFKPKTVEGRAIKIPPLVVKGFNADFDGNCVKGLTKLALIVPRPCGIRTPDIEREFIMKFAKSSKVLTVDESNVVVEINIEDFPHLSTFKTDKNGAHVHDVRSGIKVLSIDKDTFKPSFEEVTGFTIDKNHEISDVKTRKGYYVSASSNESLCVYDHETGDIRKIKPDEAIGKLSPIVQKVPSLGKKFDSETGWMIGAFASDGFFMGDQRDIIGYSKKSTPHRDRFADAVSLFEGGPIKRHTYGDFHDATKDIQGESVKDHIGIDKSADIFKQCYSPDVNNPGRDKVKERASLYKKLPCMFEYSREALIGILSGLLDGDGSVSWSTGKKKLQFLASIGTSSPYMVESIKELCRLLGIRCKDTPYAPKKGRVQKHTAYVVNLSTVDLHKVAGSIRLTGTSQKILNEFIVTGVSKDDGDIVPVPFAIMEEFASRNHECFKDDPKLVRSLATIKSSKKNPYVSRGLAKRMVPFLKKDNELHEKWRIVAEEPDSKWDIISEVSEAKPEDVYDLIVPTSKVFAVNNGLVVFDTMHVHVPVLRKAVDEAKGMLPSKHIFNPGTGAVMMSPSQEAAIGLYFLTKDGKPVPSKFQTTQAVKDALDKREIGITDLVTVAGKKTTAGRVLVDAVLPEGYQGRNQVLDKKGIRGLLVDVARNDPQLFSKTVDQLTDLGNQYAFQRGFTLSLADLQPDLPEKDALLAEAKEKAKKLDDAAKIKLYQDVDEKIKKILGKRLGEQENNLYQMVASGSRGNINQMKQIVSAPLLVEDVKGNTLPIPIDQSFSKGLDLSQYWNSLYGSRRGVVDKQLQTSKPGEFNKDLMATVVRNVISDEDCNTSDGLDMEIDNIDAQDRILAKDIKVGAKTIAKAGDVVTANLVSAARKSKLKKIKVRSPVTCKMPKGTCSKCYGLDADGRMPAIGDNIGAIAGQSMTEPLTQMVLNTMHSGGVAGAQKLTGYAKIDKLVKMPKVIMGKATLSEKTGKVSSIENAPAGGKNIFVGTEKHFVAPGNSLKVKVGTPVKQGDALSDGLIQPRELVRLKGMRAAQDYITDEITSGYRDTGINIKRKNIETVVRSMTDTTRVLDGGDSTHLFGDVIPFTMAEAFNQSAMGKVPIEEAMGKPLYKDHGPVKAGTKVGKRVAKILEGLGHAEVAIGPEPIIHEPFVDGIKQLPMLNRDWMSQMGYHHLARGIKEGAGETWTSELHGYAPVPAFAYGAEFGEGKQGQY